MSLKQNSTIRRIRVPVLPMSNGSVDSGSREPIARGARISVIAHGPAGDDSGRRDLYEARATGWPWRPDGEQQDPGSIRHQSHRRPNEMPEYLKAAIGQKWAAASRALVLQRCEAATRAGSEEQPRMIHLGQELAARQARNHRRAAVVLRRTLRRGRKLFPWNSRWPAGRYAHGSSIRNGWQANRIVLSTR